MQSDEEIKADAKEGPGQRRQQHLPSRLVKVLFAVLHLAEDVDLCRHNAVTKPGFPTRKDIVRCHRFLVGGQQKNFKISGKQAKLLPKTAIFLLCG